MPKISQLRHYIFDVNYIMPLYINDAVFVLLMVQLFRRGQWFAQSNRSKLIPAVICLLLFQAVIVIQSYFSTFPWIVLLSSVQILKIIIVFVLPTLLTPIFPKNSTIFRATALVFFATFGVQILWSLLQAVNHGPLGKFIEVRLFSDDFGIPTYEDSAMIRTTGWFFDPALLGSFLICGVSMAMWQIQKIAHLKQPILAGNELLFALLGCLAIVSTQNRILIVVSLVIVIFGLFFIRKTNFFQKIGTPLAGIALLVVILISPAIIKRFSTLSQSFDEYGSGLYRLEQFTYSMRMVAVHPEGIGLNLSPYFLATGFTNENRSIDSSHPHNIELQLLVETGWFGLLCIITFIYCVYRPYLLKQIPLNQFAIAGLAYLFCAQFYPLFVNQSELLVYLFIFLGLTQAKAITTEDR